MAIELPLSYEEHRWYDVIKYCQRYLSHFGYISGDAKEFRLLPHVDYSSMDRVVKWGYSVIPFSVVE
jgi:hypothetical protein